jgi:hypothetical protein
MIEYLRTSRIRVNGEKQLSIYVKVSRMKESTAFFQRERLLVKDSLDFLGFRVARLHADAQRAHRTGDQHLARSGLARLAGDLHAAAVETLHFVGETKRFQLEAVRAKGICFNDVSAGFDVRLMHAEDGFVLDGIHLIETPVCAGEVVQERSHRAIGDQNRVF